jgi:hypothetical protein
MGRRRAQCVFFFLVSLGSLFWDLSNLFVPVRVLQYRSVAFVTYVSEHHAQFAKEAMACQSLDNDEILNVRWATEDPNPVSKVAEKRRLEEIGQAAIRARMDPRVVDAMQSVRALEEGREYHAEDGDVDMDQEEDEGGPEGKRRRIEGPETDEPEGVEELPEAQEPKTDGPQGLLSSETWRAFDISLSCVGAMALCPLLFLRPQPRPRFNQWLRGWDLVTTGATMRIRRFVFTQFCQLYFYAHPTPGTKRSQMGITSRPSSNFYMLANVYVQRDNMQLSTLE